jgi:hypothetical protein
VQIDQKSIARRKNTEPHPRKSQGAGEERKGKNQKNPAENPPKNPVGNYLVVGLLLFQVTFIS